LGRRTSGFVTGEQIAERWGSLRKNHTIRGGRACEWFFSSKSGNAERKGEKKSKKKSDRSRPEVSRSKRNGIGEFGGRIMTACGEDNHERMGAGDQGELQLGFY